MKRFILMLLLLFYTLLEANSLSLAQFRQAHRVTILTEFKKLYKQQNLHVHKAQLRRKYSRTKKNHRPNIMQKQHISMMSDNSAESVMKHESTSTMKIEANHNMQEIQKHPENPPMPFGDMRTKEMPDSTKLTIPSSQQEQGTMPNTTGNEETSGINPTSDNTRTEFGDNENMRTQTKQEGEINRAIRSPYANPWQRK